MSKQKKPQVLVKNAQNRLVNKSITLTNGITITHHHDGFFSASSLIENDRTEWVDKNPEVAYLTAIAMANKPLKEQITRIKSGHFLLIQIKTNNCGGKTWAILEKTPIRWKIITEKVLGQIMDCGLTTHGTLGRDTDNE